MPKLKAIADYAPEIFEESRRLENEGAEPVMALKQAILMYEDYTKKECKEC